MKRQLQVNKKRITLGITGSFGSGKSTVARMFRFFGAGIIDADSLVHKIIKPRGEIYKRLINAFGESVLKKNKSIDRSRLAKIVFNNKNLLRRLNRIIHPEVIRIIRQKLKATSKQIIVLDAPLLIEAGLRKLVDKLIVVKISKKNQVARIARNRSLKKTDISKRINAQIPLKRKVRIADFVIDNNGSIKETRKQVRQIRRLLWKN